MAMITVGPNDDSKPNKGANTDSPHFYQIVDPLLVLNYLNVWLFLSLIRINAYTSGNVVIPEINDFPNK